MKITGDDFVNAICNVLKHDDEKALLYDSTIISRIRKLKPCELSQIVDLGKWSDEYYKNVQNNYRKIKRKGQKNDTKKNTKSN